MLLQVPGIAQAVVDTYEPVPGIVELVGYYSLRHDTARTRRRRPAASLRDRLPAVHGSRPTWSSSPVIPMTTSDKADRKNLPPPDGAAG